ncbi:MAG: transglutaminase domain-containing protein [Patescibacteria group bacterium]
MRSRFFSLLGFILFFFTLLTPKSYASSYFTRDYAVVYAVGEDSRTKVSVTVTLTNKTSDYYASSDTINVGFDTLEELTARDPQGAIKPIVTKTDSGNSIELPFNKHVVGKDKALVFNVSFFSPDIAHHSGKIREINIPGVANPDDFNRFSVEVKVPESFGKPNFIKPVTPDGKLLFSKELLGKSGISVVFGDEQVYDLRLTYHLGNKNLFPIRTEVAIPPTTNYQEAAISSIDPKPKNVVIDQDGNWLAQYELSPSQQFDVHVTEKIRVLRTPKEQELSPQEMTDDLKDKQFWQVSNPKIKELAQKLKTPRAIYEYVVKNLKYDFNRLTTDQPRLGAVGALERRNSAVCLEYTDLFIALARAAGIPSREVNGFAYTQNSKQRPLSLVQDILHAWPEYYDQDRKTWIMVDPTWGNTTGGTDYFNVFDFDHITFIQKGQNSQYPIPPGGYKFESDQHSKDISVQFAPVFPTNLPQVAVSADFPAEVLSGFSFKGKVKVTNNGSVLYPSNMGVIESMTLYPRRQEVTIPPLPPFGSEYLTVGFNKTPFLTNKKYDFTFNLQGTIIHKSVKVTPFSFNRNTLIGGASIVILTIIVSFFAVKAWGLFISRQK